MDATIYAVVLNWHDSKRTIRCVNTLLGCHSADHVVVVDNETECDPRVLELDRSDRCTVQVNDANLGFGRGVNGALAIAREAGASFVLLVNNDARIEDPAVSAMKRAMESDLRLGGVAPIIYFPDGAVQACGGVARPLLGDAPTTTSVTPSIDYLTGAVSMYRETALASVDDFDPRYFMYWEDVDLGLRLRRRGWRLAVLGDAAATHELSASRERAGSLLVTYYWSSLIHFTRKWRGLWLIGVPLRLTVAVVVRLLGLRPRSEIRAVWSGVSHGLSAPRRS